jgi:two-component system, cell cycle sensor histidine kinase and response regulator CckA
MTTPLRPDHFPPPATSPQPASAGRHILVLDDDTVLSELLKDALVLHSYEVTCVTSGVEGLKEIMKTDFDAILCDMMMPNLAGDMFYLAVERVKPHLCPRFIFMSGHKNDPRTDAFMRKVNGLMLWKPFDIFVMLDAIALVTRKAAAQKPAENPGASTRLPTGEWLLDP